MTLPGNRVYDIKKFPDERGFFAEILRGDWKEFLENDSIVQANLSLSYPQIIRAWHRHLRGQCDYFIVLKGAMKICAFDDDPNSPTSGELDEFVASSEKLQIVRINGKYWHGTKTVSNEPSLTVYAVNRLYDYKSPDEERRPWNDPKIIDPKTKVSFDWNRPPHK
ncbi:MAG TPA: dTDP-4-dehydrorhamnose 3,5-epimerase family protein [Nitrososphaerales archaeon]|nr:dTDP-4-dehydrorhamnose 3,5-epimerase family protein [Nitrososphaerales archaeon]